jgi:farnesyl-diphosphate farnesyltransferase
MEPGASAGERLGDGGLHDLLVESSRTFALAIPLLESDLRREVTIAYLLFRIADTLEDGGTRWSRERRLAALAEFDELLSPSGVGRAATLMRRWLEDPPTEHDGYLRLLAQMPGVVASWAHLASPARESIAEQTRRTARQMSDFVERGDEKGELTLDSLDDLRSYCYAVAGIVGEMLTELFILASSGLQPIADELRRRAPLFGEGLQLVNILKDSEVDEIEGRRFIPVATSRRELFELARADLETAAEYVRAIQRAGGPEGIVAFTALPVELAWATLERVERDGPGSKISRTQVIELYDQVRRAIAAGRPAVASAGQRDGGRS